MVELKPCPFCGGSDFLMLSNGIDSEFVVCETCGAEGPPSESPNGAVGLWNTRKEARDAE